MSYSLDDTASLRKKVDRRSESLFVVNEGKAGLQMTRKNGTSLVKNNNVWDEKQLKEVRDSLNDDLQIFTIRQRRIWLPLEISREFFESFMTIYDVFAPFWKCMFTFGFKSQENEYDFPGFSKRFSHVSKGGQLNNVHEFSYMLRRAEDRGSGELEDEDWVIRQTAVYHKLVPSTEAITSKDKSLFVMVTPSPNAESLYGQYLDRITSGKGPISPWQIHRILVADAVRGWCDYMASLERKSKTYSNQIVTSPVGAATGGLPPLTEYMINFEDRQKLKILEDLIVDLLVILPTMVKAIAGLKVQCEICCDQKAMCIDEQVEMQAITGEIEGYIDSMKICLERATTLNTSVKTTTQILSDLLNYEEAVAMKAENNSMRWLAFKSTKDAAAVKILTVITLVYLPFTIVANFFSTEFVQSEKGKLSLTDNYWLLFAIAVPLTGFTLILWWAWVHFTQLPDVIPAPVEYATRPSSGISSHRLKSIGSWKKQKPKDLECGPDLEKGSLQTFSPGAGTTTWSTRTTV